jgi:hypothetical protein
MREIDGDPSCCRASLQSGVSNLPEAAPGRCELLLCEETTELRLEDVTPQRSVRGGPPRLTGR